jgi:hypothetical protein
VSVSASLQSVQEASMRGVTSLSKAEADCRARAIEMKVQ